MTGNVEDEILIQACLDGNTQAFGEIVRRYQDRLYPTLLRLTGSAEDAQDLLQESFLRAYQKLRRFQGGSSFYTWLYRLSVNLALSDKRRMKGKRRPRLSELGPGQEIDPADPSSLDGPGVRLEESERNAAIQEALDQLPADQRVVVVLKEFEGMAYEEIAATLGIPIGTVRSRLHRARGELKHLLRDLIEADERTCPETSREPG